MTQYDVAIAGAGPAGSATAIALARGGARVAVWDPRPSRVVVGESLVPSARTLLAELGVWERFLADGHAPCYGNLSAWGSSELAEQDFIRSPYGHGWHLDRGRFDGTLREAAREAGAAFVEELPSARWAVDATGRASAVARGRGVKRIVCDRLVAFFATCRSESGTDEESRTLVESAAEGWWHTARLPEGTRVVTWFTDGDLGAPASSRPVRRLPGGPGETRRQDAAGPAGWKPALRLTTHVSRALSEHGYVQCGDVRSADARSARLERFHGEDWIAVGDAALSFDPISSQGILSALYSGVKAANAILSGGLEAYDSAMTSLWDAFSVNQKAVYAVETRWRTPFWQRRL